MSFIYSGKWSTIAYLWMAKVCESLGLAVHLKAKLKSIGAEVVSVSAMTKTGHVLTFDIQRSIKVWSCLWKWIMSRTKEITEDLWKRVVVVHQARKGWKMEEIQDYCYFPEKFFPKKEPVIVCEVAKETSRVTSKQLKAFLTVANVHEPTIRRTLSNHGVIDRVARRKPLFSKN